MSYYKYPIVLTIAGSDSGGGAGIQADLKTFSALGCFGTTAITALTVQNTLGVSAVHAIPRDIVAAQIEAVISDMKPLAIKIGMVYNSETAESIADVLEKHSSIPVIFDPVMVSSSGFQLVENDTITVFKSRLFPKTTLLTPNLDEAALLAGMQKIENIVDMKLAASKIIDFGCNAILIKGGHLKSSQLYDVFLSAEGDVEVFESTFIKSDNTHGTGCTLSSAIAAYLALGNTLSASIVKSKAYLQLAIEHGKNVNTGEGNGPLNHFFDPVKLQFLPLDFFS